MPELHVQPYRRRAIPSHGAAGGERVFQRAQRYMYHVVTEVEARGMPLEFALLPVVLLLTLLVAAQLFITRRTRRLVNIPLALATLVLLGFVGWFSYVAESGRSAILTAKEDAYDDLQALYRAKVTAYLMKADESMWLFELRKARFEQKRARLNAKVAAKAGTPTSSITN